jgi:putative ABC transport system permease protein
METYAIMSLRSQPLRTILSIGGIALCVLLMLFLIGVYRGVEEGSLEFIHHNRADLWVLQGNATNLLRCTSILKNSSANDIVTIAGVKSVAPLFLLLATVRDKDIAATVYLAGYSPGTGLGGPPEILEGRTINSSDEIVLDQAFAYKYGYEIGDTVTLQGCRLNLVGICGGTNAFVIQYAFVNLQRSWQLAGFSGIVTCFMVNLDNSRTSGPVSQDIQKLIPNTKVFEHADFIKNNLREMQAGFLPFVSTLAFLGAVVLISILSLLLSISIIERSRDFAVMKTFGASSSFLWQLVTRQALLIVGIGTAIAIGLFPLLAHLIQAITPEVAAKLSAIQIIEVASVAIIVGVISSLIAMSRLRHIYALEAFK